MRIHITGASGSGVSTLGRTLAGALGFAAVDADDFYWLPTEPRFTQPRDRDERLQLALGALANTRDAVLAGSCMGWGAALEDSFDFVVFLYLAASIRVERIRAREIARQGHAPAAFLTWAAQYDEGPPSGRSLARHTAWLATRACPVLELRGDLTVDERLDRVLAALPPRTPSS